MLYVLTIGGGVVFLILAFLVGINENISLIPAMTEGKVKQVKRKKKVAIDFGVHYLFIALACFATAALSIFVGKVGLYIGLGLVVIAAFAYSALSSSINDKLRRNIY